MCVWGAGGVELGGGAAVVGEGVELSKKPTKSLVVKFESKVDEGSTKDPRRQLCTHIKVRS